MSNEEEARVTFAERQRAGLARFLAAQGIGAVSVPYATDVTASLVRHNAWLQERVRDCERHILELKQRNNFLEYNTKTAFQGLHRELVAENESLRAEIDKLRSRRQYAANRTRSLEVVAHFAEGGAQRFAEASDLLSRWEQAKRERTAARRALVRDGRRINGKNLWSHPEGVDRFMKRKRGILAEHGHGA